MNLNRINSGRKFIDFLVKKGHTKNMGWTNQQQQDMLVHQKNIYTPETRNHSDKRS